LESVTIKFRKGYPKIDGLISESTTECIVEKNSSWHPSDHDTSRQHEKLIDRKYHSFFSKNSWSVILCSPSYPEDQNPQLL